MSSRGDRFDRERLAYDRDRDYDRDRYDDDRYYMRGGRGGRDHSDERHERRPARPFDDDDYVRDRRYYDDEPRSARLPPRDPRDDYDRRVVMEKERDREYYRDPSTRRPTFLRRQSSLDTYDRRPLRIFNEREEYPPPARREDIYRDDYRVPYPPAPLPKSRGLPPPRRHGDRGFYDEIDVADPDHYGDDEYRPMPPRVHEKEYVRTRRRRDSHGSATTRTHTHRSSSRSSTTTSRSSSSSGGTTIRSEYPKKGKTRIPARLVSKRAIIDIGYPFIEEGNIIIIQKALGQENIDELLRLSEEYKKSELEILAARSSAGDIEDRREIFVPAGAIMPPPTKAPTVITAPAAPPPAPVHAAPPPPPPAPAPAPAPAPVIIEAAPPPPPAPVEEVVTKTVIRDVSPTRTFTTSTSSWDSESVGPAALVHRPRSRSRTGREIRAEIRALERELAHRPKHGVSEREIVRTERLPNGELVVYQESVEKVVSHPKPPRIEKDKKGPPPALMRAMLSTLT